MVRADPGIASTLPVQRTGEDVLVQAVPTWSPSGEEVRATIPRLRAALPPAALVGGAVAENLDLELALADSTPVVAVVFALGFLLLLVALRAPLLALVGVALNVVATLAAFGMAKWVFQDGIGAGLPVPRRRWG